MAFLDMLLNEVSELENNMDYLWREIQGATQIVIWGTGLAGNMIYDTLKWGGGKQIYLPIRMFKDMVT